jgi:hypothetical protein
MLIVKLKAQQDASQDVYFKFELFKVHFIAFLFKLYGFA